MSDRVGGGDSLLTATLLLPSGETVCVLTDVLDILVPGRGRRFLARGPKSLLDRSLPELPLTVHMRDGKRFLVTITYVSLSIDRKSSVLLGKIMA
jgi:hypothetical protein